MSTWDYDDSSLCWLVNWWETFYPHVDLCFATVDESPLRNEL